MHTMISASPPLPPMKAFVPGNASDLPMISSSSTPLCAVMSATSIVPVTSLIVRALPAAPLAERRPGRALLPLRHDDPGDARRLSEDALRGETDDLPSDVPHDEAQRAPDRGRRPRLPAEAARAVGDAERVARRAVHEYAGDHAAGGGVEREEVDRLVG